MADQLWLMTRIREEEDYIYIACLITAVKYKSTVCVNLITVHIIMSSKMTLFKQCLTLILSLAVSTYVG